MGANLDALDSGLADNARALDAAVHQSGLIGNFTSTWRSRAEQTRLYNRFLAGASRYPAAPPGQSAHEYGWAFDYVVSPRVYQEDVGALWESWGGTWGGRFQDEVHFELPGARESAIAAYQTSQPSFGQKAYSAVVEAGEVSFDFIWGSGLAFLLSLGFPKNQALKILSSPSGIPEWVISGIKLPRIR